MLLYYSYLKQRIANFQQKNHLLKLPVKHSGWNNFLLTWNFFC